MAPIADGHPHCLWKPNAVSIAFSLCVCKTRLFWSLPAQFTHLVLSSAYFATVWIGRSVRREVLAEHLTRLGEVPELADMKP